MALEESEIAEVILVDHNEALGQEESNDPDPEDGDGIIQASLVAEGDTRVKDNIYEGFDPADYDGLGNTVFMPEGGVAQLNKDRANNQSFFEQAGGFLAQTVVGELVGGTIEAFGYMLDIGSIYDLMKGEEVDFGNFMTDFGQGIREDVEEATRIYQDPSAQGMDKAYDSGWWFQNAVSFASTLTLMIPSMAATRALSFIGKGVRSSATLSKGLSATRKAAGMAEEMGAKGRWIQESLSQAVVSRNIENWMEAHGTYKDKKEERLNQINPKTGVLFTEEEANRDASDAAAENYRNGWLMLGQDFLQYASIGKVFNPATRKMESALSNAAKKGLGKELKPWQRKVRAVGSTFLSEGSEEAYQFYISERAKLASDLKSGLIDQVEFNEKVSEVIGSEGMNTSAFFGGLGGNIFQAAGGPVGNVLKSKSRKEQEANMGKFYETRVKTRAAIIAAMQQELATADQDGRGGDRKELIDNYMLNAVEEALESDTYDQFYESIDAMGKMTAEDKIAYTEITGGSEFNTDLAQEYIPGILARAEAMRAIYLRHRGKNSSKKVSSKLAKLEVDNNRWKEKKKENRKKIDEIKESLSDSKTSKATQELQDKWEITEDIAVTEDRIKDAQARMDSYKSPEIKSHYHKIKRENENRLKVLKQKKAKQFLDSQNKKPTEEEENNNAEAQLAYDVVSEEILAAKGLDGAIDDQITYNTHDMKFTRSPEGLKSIKKKEERDLIESFEEEADIKKGLVDLETNETFTAEEKKSLTDKLQDKLATIEAKEKAERDEEIAREIAEAEEDRLADSQEDEFSVTNQRKVPIGDSVEDVNQDLEVDTNKILLDKDDKTIKERVEGSRSVPLLDKVRGTETYQEWVENGAPKIGKKFKYIRSPRSSYDPKEKAALLDFDSAVAGAIPQSVYDHFPIMAQLSTNEKVFTYLPAKPPSDRSVIEHERYENNYAAQRRIIIDRLKAGESTEVEVKHTSGGNLQMDPNPREGFVAENSILDIAQIDGVKDVDIMITDFNGNFVDTTGELDSEFRGYTMHAGLDKDGNKMPYRGGLFIKVKKADGTTFPLRANFLKNTEEQALVLADLLIDVAVPALDGSLLATDSYLEDANPILQEKIKEAFGPELEMLALGEDGSNPSISDILDMFLYVNERTNGLTSELSFKDGVLSFDQGKKINASNRNSNELKSKLVSFLNHKKRRQFSIAFWRDKPGYKEFVLENKIINTNATVNPKNRLFKNDTKRNPKTGKQEGRAAKIFLEPILSMATEIPKNSTPKQREILERMEKTKAIGMKMALDGHLEGSLIATYFYPNSRISVMDMASMAEALERYEKELSALSKSVQNGVKNTIGQGRTKDESAAAAAKVVMPKSTEKKASKVSDTKISLDGKKRVPLSKQRKASNKTFGNAANPKAQKPDVPGKITPLDDC